MIMNRSVHKLECIEEMQVVWKAYSERRAFQYSNKVVKMVKRGIGWPWILAP
jgi:hypothetical protein